MKIFVYPTDTVWGIGASIYDLDANIEIASIKGTDSKKPLSILMSSFEHFLTFFSIPKEVDQSVLQEMFALNATLGIPAHWKKKEIPEQVYAHGDWIGVRCLNLKIIKKIIDDAGSPVTTTSLNYSGEEPIINKDEAKKFCNKNSQCTFYQPDLSDPAPDGKSSTLILISSSEPPKIIRQGKYSSELMSYAARLFTA